MEFFVGCYTKEEVKARYRELSLRWHPDRPEGDEETMKQINASYQSALDWAERRQPSEAVSGDEAGGEEFIQVMFLDGVVVYYHTRRTQRAARPETDDPLELYVKARAASAEKEACLAAYRANPTAENQQAYFEAASRYSELLKQILGTL